MIRELSQSTIDEYASDIGAVKERPVGEDYTLGAKVGKTIPAKWWNWLFSATTKHVMQGRDDMQNIFTEMKNVLTDSGIEPNPADNTQLSQAITAKAENTLERYIQGKGALGMDWEGSDVTFPVPPGLVWEQRNIPLIIPSGLSIYSILGCNEHTLIAMTPRTAEVTEILYSRDGITWIKSSVPSPAYSFSNLETVNRAYFIDASTGASSPAYKYVSTDNGETWHKAVYTSNGQSYDTPAYAHMVWTGTKYMCAINEAYVLESSDGINFNSLTAQVSAGTVISKILDVHNGLYLCVLTTDAGDDNYSITVAYTTDFTSFTEVSGINAVTQHGSTSIYFYRTYSALMSDTGTIFCNTNTNTQEALMYSVDSKNFSDTEGVPGHTCHAIQYLNGEFLVHATSPSDGYLGVYTASYDIVTDKLTWNRQATGSTTVLGRPAPSLVSYENNLYVYGNQAGSSLDAMMPTLQDVVSQEQTPTTVTYYLNGHFVSYAYLYQSPESVSISNATSVKPDLMLDDTHGLYYLYSGTVYAEIAISAYRLYINRTNLRAEVPRNIDILYSDANFIFCALYGEYSDVTRDIGFFDLANLKFYKVMTIRYTDYLAGCLNGVYYVLSTQGGLLFTDSPLGTWHSGSTASDLISLGYFKNKWVLIRTTMIQVSDNLTDWTTLVNLTDIAPADVPAGAVFNSMTYSQNRMLVTIYCLASGGYVRLYYTDDLETFHNVDIRNVVSIGYNKYMDYINVYSIGDKFIMDASGTDSGYKHFIMASHEGIEWTRVFADNALTYRMSSPLNYYSGRQSYPVYAFFNKNYIFIRSDAVYVSTDFMDWTKSEAFDADISIKNVANKASLLELSALQSHTNPLERPSTTYTPTEHSIYRSMLAGVNSVLNHKLYLR